MFFIFSDKLGCVMSIAVSILITILLLVAFGVF
jgi:hypothetical protein